MLKNRPGVSPAPSKSNGDKRVSFHEPPAFVALTSLWVSFAPIQGGATVTLLHDYPDPDFKPEAGWRIEVDGATFEIKTVSGRVLTCFVVPS